VHITEVLQKWKNLLQVLFLHQNTYKHPFCHLISMDHKGSIVFLISSLRVNKLFHRSGNSYPTTKPHRSHLNSFTWFFSEIWQGFRARLVKVIYYILQYPLPKNLGTPTTITSILSLKWNRLLIHHLKIPKVITHELPHNHSKNPWHNHLLLYVGPYKKTYQTSKHFLDSWCSRISSVFII